MVKKQSPTASSKPDATGRGIRRSSMRRDLSPPPCASATASRHFWSAPALLSRALPEAAPRRGERRAAAPRRCPPHRRAPRQAPLRPRPRPPCLHAALPLPPHLLVVVLRALPQAPASSTHFPPPPRALQRLLLHGSATDGARARAHAVRRLGARRPLLRFLNSNGQFRRLGLGWESTSRVHLRLHTRGGGRGGSGDGGGGCVSLRILLAARRRSSRREFLRTLASMGFIGVLSPRIGELDYLNVLSLPGNYITGSIPEQFGNLSRLTSLDLEDNLLDGAIPDSLGKLCNQAPRNKGLKAR